MNKAVERGLDTKECQVTEYLGIDEKSFAKSHRYETLICDLRKGTM
ncbi:MAG: hypothetical protein JRH18_14700 [Deltaproteobacteria bacterium]|nr:hypothetical protein [Deltaproteobacteria bacterium]MBW2152905.1 hypothetical protein [Deltaproteobacteria bacterium]